MTMRNSASRTKICGALRKALMADALPGEIDDLDNDEIASIVAILTRAALEREPETPVIHLHSQGMTTAGRRRMTMAIVNDDMPFLVDSIAQTVTSHGIDIHRLLHPVVAAQRDQDGTLVEILPRESSALPHESIVYLELERADARVRRQLEQALFRVLADVRAAVRDWTGMQAALREDADRLSDAEGAALLHWFLDRHFTQLGHRIESRDGSLHRPLGVLSTDPAPLWSDATREAAFAWFEKGAHTPLLLKSNRHATVHRHVPLDLIVTPARDPAGALSLSVHAGLWTSAALKASPDMVPVLRARLETLERKFGFDPHGHAGKTLRHVLASLPHDLLIGFDPPALERLALATMSLVDRPRPRLMLVPSVLGDHLFAFVWLPRDEVSTLRRRMIGDMLARATEAPLVSWGMELGDGDLALVRFTFALPPASTPPDAEALDRQLAAMLRGWPTAVEAALSESLPPARATRLAISHAAALPLSYRERYDAHEAAQDILRLAALSGPDARTVRIYRIEGDEESRLRLKLYRANGLMPLSAAVPVLENFGFSVLKEVPTRLDGATEAHIHEFLVSTEGPATARNLCSRADTVETALSDVLAGRTENDAFNQLVGMAGLAPREALLFRAWFRYMRQVGLAYGLQTVVDALKRAPAVAGSIIALFDAAHDPDRHSAAAVARAEAEIDDALLAVSAIDDDRILRWLRSLVRAIVRTNAFAPAGREALAFKIDSSKVPGLPAPTPWREIWVYSRKVEGIHLRGGPIARGGLRWSDRRDDFRTEILGLMKAQIVKNAVIVPTGAKGGFYPKQLPSPADRDAWVAEGIESYRSFIRTLLSVTDNIVDGRVTHPDRVTVLDDDDPYFVVAADKGTATFSDIANALAAEHGFWLGDAFASGGSHGYDHKAMGITARGAWISVQRHFAELGIDVQSQPISIAGCGDMSGDVFGNGMLQSGAIRLVAAFDHRHIFLDPDPDPAKSRAERARLFALPRSSWADYDPALISRGGGVFPRSQKAIALSAEVRALLGVPDETLDPSSLIMAILKSPVDLLWFGGIGTFIKAATESNLQVGDPANDAHRVNGEDVRARAIGEGANLGVTQAGRIAFALGGGRINTDFIDNSAGVDCSDNEVNIKIPLNQAVAEGRLGFEERNAFLKAMTDDVAAIVLEDNRLQTLALSIAERGGTAALPAHIRIIEMLEARGRLNRTVDGLASNEVLNRRLQDGQALTRPELAVLLSHTKLALQQAIERSRLPEDPLLAPMLAQAFPPAMRERFGSAISQHRLRNEIIATKLANRIVNRLGFVAPLELGEQEGASLAMVATTYVAIDAIFGIEALIQTIGTAGASEAARLALLAATGDAVRLHMADLLRCAPADSRPTDLVARLGKSIDRLGSAVTRLLRSEASLESAALRASLLADGADPEHVARVAQLHELDSAIGNAMLARSTGMDEIAVTRAYVRLGEALGLDWARAAINRFRPADGWERLLAAGLGRDFEQLRLDFLARMPGDDPVGAIEQWLDDHKMRVQQFRGLVDRARMSAAPTGAMLAQIASQARILLSR